ncbi:hypothetical protein GVN20_09620 [Runella sp. CRIBMP]|uniref:hypothetical protein n=1 Tax=Runella sp. CRIBMP TaxID=2683261 RepID=UPI001411CFF8|nr:hypothetical protein [Runella sp. CRIBMP]NBB19608.1 hypothetical protein [Runella sp. CRIBMP]
MTELQKNSRNHIMDFFYTLASNERQIGYKRFVPFVHIPYELIAQWDGFYKYHQNQKWFRDIWNENELKWLRDFDNKFNESLDMLPKDIPDIPEIFENTHWLQIMQLAKETLDKFTNQ